MRETSLVVYQRNHREVPRNSAQMHWGRSKCWRAGSLQTFQSSSKGGQKRRREEEAATLRTEGKCWSLKDGRGDTNCGRKSVLWDDHVTQWKKETSVCARGSGSVVRINKCPSDHVVSITNHWLNQQPVHQRAPSERSARPTPNRILIRSTNRHTLNFFERWTLTFVDASVLLGLYVEYLTVKVKLDQ